MAVLKFRIYFEEDESVYRDIAIKHKQFFSDLHTSILKAFEFDSKHAATFFRSNDQWAQGREISLQKYDKNYAVAPLLMAETTIGSEIFDTNQKFIYLYDFEKNWRFLVELINVSKTSSDDVAYPAVVRVEGIGPQQYGTRSLFGNKFLDVEEKYDLNKGEEGFGEEGETDDSTESDDVFPEEQATGMDDYE
ncbi:MAG: hypothetical protein EAY72_12025 [Bacteroidetes bacterium]|jgi:hypothetical protein|nr:MAG: hypothetical protein EAY72_12025 [Bacteroidota bacterium]